MSPPRASGSKKTGLWVALGCGGLLLVFAGVAAATWFFVTRRTERALESLPQLPSGAFPLPSLLAPLPHWVPPLPGLAPVSPPAGPAAAAAGGRSGSDPGLPIASGGTGTPGARASGGGSAAPAAGAAAGGAGAGSSATCKKAIACCKVLLARAPAAPGFSGNCDAVPTFSEDVCQRQLDAYRQAAGVLGLSCP